MNKDNRFSIFSSNNTTLDSPVKFHDKRKVWVQAFGCSANIADAEMIKGILYNSGYELTATRKNSDLNIIVTCAVKDATEHRMISKIKKYSREKPLVVCQKQAKN